MLLSMMFILDVSRGRWLLCKYAGGHRVETTAHVSTSIYWPSGPYFCTARLLDYSTSTRYLVP